MTLHKMTTLQKMVLCAQVLDALPVEVTVDFRGIMLSNADFERLTPEMPNIAYEWWGISDNHEYVTKSCVIDGVNIYSYYHRDNDGYIGPDVDVDKALEVLANGN